MFNASYKKNPTGSTRWDLLHFFQTERQNLQRTMQVTT